MEQKTGDNGPRLEMWDVGKVRPYEKNPRTIPDKAVAKLRVKHEAANAV